MYIIPKCTLKTKDISVKRHLNLRLSNKIACIHAPVDLVYSHTIPTSNLLYAKYSKLPSVFTQLLLKLAEAELSSTLGMNREIMTRKKKDINYLIQTTWRNKLQIKAYVPVTWYVYIAAISWKCWAVAWTLTWHKTHKCLSLDLARLYYAKGSNLTTLAFQFCMCS